MRIGCVILAAGNSSRFQGNKLFADFRGNVLISYAFACIPKESREDTRVITQYEEVALLAKSFGCSSIMNSNPDLGISHSIHLGTKALSDCDGILFLLADQPLLRPSSCEKIIKTFQLHPDKIACAKSSDHIGNPAVFPKKLFPELLALRGDRGGNQIIKSHPELTVNVEINSEELWDCDTKEDFARLKSS